jgi:hypothetical protein
MAEGTKLKALRYRTHVWKQLGSRGYTQGSIKVVSNICWLWKQIIQLTTIYLQEWQWGSKKGFQD